MLLSGVARASGAPLGARRRRALLRSDHETSARNSLAATGGLIKNLCI